MPSGNGKVYDRQNDGGLQWWQQSGQWLWLHELEQEQEQVKIDQMIPSKWLKQSDIDGEALVTVESVKRVNVAREDEDPEYKFTIKFAEYERGMVLNSTNIKRLGKALGDDSDAWIGKQVVIYVDPDIEYAGTVTGGLRIRAATKRGTPTAPGNIDDGNRKARAAADDQDVPF
jgi:hypothetical protein